MKYPELKIPTINEPIWLAISMTSYTSAPPLVKVCVWLRNLEIPCFVLNSVNEPISFHESATNDVGGRHA